MRQKTQAICLLLSASLLFAPGVSLSAQAKMPESILSAENNSETMTPERVDELIAQIGNVTPKRADAIAKAENAYLQLDEASRSLVQNAGVLTEAQQVLEIQQVLEKLWVQRDDIERRSWIEGSVSCHSLSRSIALPYFGYFDDSGIGPLRWKIAYYSTNWVFYKTVVFAIDDETYYKTFDYWDVLRNNANGYVWEVADFVATNEDIELLQKIAASEKTVIRFKGDNDRAQYVVQKKDKELIPLLLHAYELMNNASTEVQLKALAGINQKNY